MYKILRPILFLVSPERIHHIVFFLLRIAGRLPGFKSLMRLLYQKKDIRLERQLFGLTFSNPVGLAAGLDKNALLIDEFASFGFGFVEIGTVTPKPQPGNDKPRLFRLPKDLALINRMGFNNDGVDKIIVRLKRKKSRIIVGGNIGKNKVTPNENALDDYAICFEALFPWVDYFVVNVSSPNTPGLRELQEKEPLRKLLLHVKQLNKRKSAPKPLLLKISPDLTEQQLQDIVDILKETQLDGVIATNTTVSRSNLITDKARLDEIGVGGLSGKPLTNHSTEVIRFLRQQLGETFPIIGVGGIMCAEDAMEKIRAGANLVQVYTGFIYEGPKLVKRINELILEIS